MQPSLLIAILLICLLATAKVIEEIIRHIEGPKYIGIGPSPVSILTQFHWELHDKFRGPVQENILNAKKRDESVTWTLYQLGYNEGYENLIRQIKYHNLLVKFAPILQPLEILK